MSRPTIIAGNWKMHKTIGEATRFVEDAATRLSSNKARVLLAPPFPSIAPCAQAAEASPIEIGAQNMSDADQGALTGEVSATMLKDAGATFVLLGHSERRTLFGETSQFIHSKLKRALEAELTPILCIGESIDERESGHSNSILAQQLDEALGDLSPKDLKDLVVAYEPVWAIGTGKAATPDLAQETHISIRSHIAKQFGEDFAQSLPILYGGSVKPENINTLMNQPDIDGALIGGASLDVEAFTQMVNS